MSETQKTILTVYALFFVGSILMMIPMGVIPFAGLSCLLVGLGSAYIYRWRSGDDTPQIANHMTYIIRTNWWGALILLIGIIVFTSIIMVNGDLSMIHALTEQANKGIIPTENDVRIMQHQFLHNNIQTIEIAALVGLLPYPLYIIFRVIKGVRGTTKKRD